jgi:predicted outer membrane repeat protein
MVFGSDHHMETASAVNSASEITNCTFINNTAQSGGGGINLDSNGYLWITDATIDELRHASNELRKARTWATVSRGSIDQLRAKVEQLIEDVRATDGLDDPAKAFLLEHLYSILGALARSEYGGVDPLKCAAEDAAVDARMNPDVMRSLPRRLLSGFKEVLDIATKITIITSRLSLSIFGSPPDLVEEPPSVEIMETIAESGDIWEVEDVPELGDGTRASDDATDDEPEPTRDEGD